MIKSMSRRGQPTALRQSLHECIELSFALLPEYAYRGLRCQTKSDTKLLLHYAITPYVADIPETEDLLGLI